MQTITNSHSTIGTSSSVVTALTENFRYGIFCNDSANIIYLSIGADAVVGSGVRLNANGGTFEINRQNPVRGDVHAIATGASSNLSFVTIN